ncbi:hypothetical protein NMY22_g9708 [Coprinellus aureogranulatus]|nr:hypothetical protein NMY22_g9708 [Coprinellus aureogranulatus]
MLTRRSCYPAASVGGWGEQERSRVRAIAGAAAGEGEQRAFWVVEIQDVLYIAAGIFDPDCTDWARRGPGLPRFLSSPDVLCVLQAIQAFYSVYWRLYVPWTTNTLPGRLLKRLSLERGLAIMTSHASQSGADLNRPESRHPSPPYPHPSHPSLSELDLHPHLHPGSEFRQ